MAQECPTVAADTAPFVHAPWCDDHHDDGHPEDSFCRCDRRVSGYHVQINNADEQSEPVIWLESDHTGSFGDMTPAQARELAATLVALADAATPVGDRTLRTLETMYASAGLADLFDRDSVTTEADGRREARRLGGIAGLRWKAARS